jgi:hypothetical protein
MLVGALSIARLSAHLNYISCAMHTTSCHTQSLQYGDDPKPFTEPLAAFLSRHYGSAVKPEQLYPACGVSGALDLAIGKNLTGRIRAVNVCASCSQ